MKVLVIAAHPDDEVLGCGGTIARLAAEGHEVYSTILGEGVTSRYTSRDQADSKLLHDLHARRLEAARILGATDVNTDLLPDNRFDTVPLLDVVKTVEKLVAQISPQIIYTHHRGDLNTDHEVVARAVLTATRPIAGHVVRELYAFEVLSSTEWAFQQIEPVFRPNTFVDISSTLEAKVRAMQQYESEARVFPHPRAPESLTSVARRWGSTVGVNAAEAFQLIRSIR